MNSAAAPALRPLDLRAMAKEAALTAFVVLLLAIGIVGFDIVDISGGVAIENRLNDVAAAVVIAFAGRIVLILYREARYRAVLSVLIPVSAILFVLLLARTLAPLVTSREGVGDALAHILPFRDPYVAWTIFLVCAAIAVRTVIATRQKVVEYTAEQRERRAEQAAIRTRRIAFWLGPIVLIVAAALPFMPFANRQVLDISILVGTYVMLGWGLNVVVGLAGLLDLGYVAFYAVGAYSYALLAQTFGAGFWVCLPLAGIMSATAGVILGFPVLRLRGDYLAIVTLGFGEMVRVILVNWVSLTNGPNGINHIARPTFFGLPLVPDAPEGQQTFFTFFGLDYSPITRIIFLYYVILALALVTNLFTLRVRRLPIGRAWEALREDEIACSALGVNPRNTKLAAFGIGAMFAGFAGSFFATRQGFISPESFTFIESAIILAIVVLGGMGSQIGVVFAAAILVGLPELFRELQQYRMLAFGAAMIIIMVWRPRGLLAGREPTIRLHPAPAGTRPGRSAVAAGGD